MITHRLQEHKAKAKCVNWHLICNPSIGEEEAGGSQGHWHGGLAKTMISKLQTPCLKNKVKSDKKKKIQCDL